jgi:hypothetical protein
VIGVFCGAVHGITFLLTSTPPLAFPTNPVIGVTRLGFG